MYIDKTDWTARPFFFEAIVDHRDIVTRLGYPRFHTQLVGGNYFEFASPADLFAHLQVQGPEMLILPDETVPAWWVKISHSEQS